MLFVLIASYAWPHAPDAASLGERIAPPPGYRRQHVTGESFAAWLRGLPTLPGRPEVLLHSGKKKTNQSAHAVVIDIDVGERDLQQCADAVIRLRAEYLWSRGQQEQVAFHYTSGALERFSAWPLPHDHAAFRAYLDDIFMYAGTRSLEKELAPASTIEIGDVFIQGGSPGHAMLVVDLAENPDTGARVFLLLQSYMPAQNVHVVVNPNHTELSPWYATDFGDTLQTAEWTFRRQALRRFR